MVKTPKVKEWTETVSDLYPELFCEASPDGLKKLCHTVTFQVVDSCNLRCTYCYQINKGERRMTWDTAKEVIDRMLDGGKNFDSYVSPERSPGIVLEFIGGEPFLAVDLIDQICDYFVGRLIELDHPWLHMYRFSVCSNGTLYFTPRVQEFLAKHVYDLSFSITLDGTKELHDRCRVFPDGRGSYDIAVAAIKDWVGRGNYIGSKITIAPANLHFLDEALRHMIGLGYTYIHANCVYEEGWDTGHAREYYRQLKSFADYMLENDLVDKVTVVIFDEQLYSPLSAEDNDNYCGGNGMMLACDPDGYLYPCIRYMESSIGNEVPPYRIGDVRNGIAVCEAHKKCVDCLRTITRRSQSSDECFECPIAKGCGNCNGYSYQRYGTPDKKATFICPMHKAESLANVYYWNSYYIRTNQPYRFKMYCPKEWAVEIVGEDEYEFLLSLQRIEKGR